MTLKGAAAITGYAEFPPTKNPEELSSLAIIAKLARDTADDAGFEKDEIDGLLTTTPIDSFSLFWPTVVGESLGMKLRYFDTVELGGASAAGMIWRAAAAIEAGLCRNVLCVVAGVTSGGGSLQLGHLSPAARSEFDAPFGISQPNAGYALIARRHMHEFGTTSEQMAKIAVDQRTNALRNPIALFNKEPLTIDMVLNSPLVFDPLHLLEIVSRCSGGAAVLVSSRDLARKSANRPVYLIGAGEAGTHLSIAARRNITESWVKDSTATAFSMAGVLPKQMDFVQVYDCYTITVLVTLEDMGFCPKGYGGPFVAEHDLTFSGDLPLNTNGGQLSVGQPGTAGGMIHVVEAARQLMGRGDARQVRNASLGIAHGNGGVMGDQVTLVLANQ
ncbi:thiolase family protein [Bradyrhizobium erythrophlei]|uniref:thiolase family protein n=1 Tax=Bradyrhizobium erythrophlei TaxID=1437360 RepID=UPI0035E968F4